MENKEIKKEQENPIKYRILEHITVCGEHLFITQKSSFTEPYLSDKPGGLNILGGYSLYHSFGFPVSV